MWPFRRYKLADLDERLDTLNRSLQQLSDLDGPRIYAPVRPRDGYFYAPPAIFRKLRQLEKAMKGNDEKRVRHLQLVLAYSAYEVPTKISEIEPIRQRLEKRINLK